MLISSTVSYAGDIWSLGCVIYEMLTGKNLVPVVSKTEVSRRLRTAKSIQIWRESRGDIILNPLSSLKCIPVEFILTGESAKLIDSMMRYVPDDRLTIENVLLQKWFHGLVKPRDIQINCFYLDEEDLQVATETVEKYLTRRNIDLPEPFFTKIVEMYSLSSMGGTIDIESSIQIVSKLHNLKIEDYHPLTKTKELTSTEINICSSKYFRLHKTSCNSLLVDLGSGT